MLYDLINPLDYIDKKYGEENLLLPFDSSEIRLLKSLLKKDFDIAISDDNSTVYYKSENESDKYFREIAIVKLKDSWFLVRDFESKLKKSSESHYLCDQRDSLKQCLRKI